MKKTNKLQIITIFLISTALIGAIGLILLITHENISNWSSDKSRQAEVATHLTKTGTKTKKTVESTSHIKKESKFPVITLKDATIEEGQSFNVLDGVTAKDSLDKDITKEIETEGTVNTNKPGTYTVKLSVHDNKGNKTTVQRKIVVEQNRTTASTSANSITNDSEITEQQTPDNTEPRTENQITTDNQSTTSDSTQTEKTESLVEASTHSVSTAPTYEAMSVYLNGQTIPYKNGGQSYGQSIIDANPESIISTWGGAANQSGTDGQPTHFIGHNPGVFSVLFNVTLGNQIVVTDGDGTPTVYTVSSIFQVNHYGEGINDGVDYWDTITGTGGGERITLQTCVNNTVNLIIIAIA